MDVVALPRADVQRPVGQVEDLVPRVRVLRGALARVDLEQRRGQMLGAREQSDEHVEVAPPDDVAPVDRSQSPRALPGRGELPSRSSSA